MSIDDLIRSSLAVAEDDMTITKEEKTDLLLDVLTEFLKQQINDGKSE